MSYIPEIKKDTLNIDYNISEEFDTLFIIDKFIGTGGGATVYKSKVTETNDRLSLYYGMDIAIKLCNPDLTYRGCDMMKEELANTVAFSSLNYRKLCYNYPIAYGFFHKCIFFKKEDVNFIVDYIDDNNIKEGRDAFIIYCSTPPNINIDCDIIKYLLDKYKEDKLEFLNESRKKFPKSDNAYGLYLLSKRKEKYIDWNLNEVLYDYLDYLQDLKCDMFLLLQYLKGNDLLELRQKSSLNKFTDTLFFESIYSTVCAISVLNIVPREVQESNAMIIETNNPRIYLYKNDYYIVEGDMFYWIDFQVINKETLISKDLIHFKNLFTQDQKDVIDLIFFKSDFPSVENVLDILFDWLKTKNIKILDRKTANKYMMINYNYKLVNVDELLSYNVNV